MSYVIQRRDSISSRLDRRGIARVCSHVGRPYPMAVARLKKKAGICCICQQPSGRSSRFLCDDHLSERTILTAEAMILACVESALVEQFEPANMN